jgi:hypothetical protein
MSLRTIRVVNSLRFSPEVDARGRRYRFTGRIALDRLFAGVVDFPTGVASPTGFDREYEREIVAIARRAA